MDDYSNSSCSSDEFEIPQITNCLPDCNVIQNSNSLSQLNDLIPDYVPFKKGYQKNRRLSVALPSSIISDVQTPQLKAYLISQIARILTIFGVYEIILFEDKAHEVSAGSPYKMDSFLNVYKNSNTDIENSNNNSFTFPPCPLDSKGENNDAIPQNNNDNDNSEDYDLSDLPVNVENINDRKWSESLYLFTLNLVYLETPQYLRKLLFKVNKGLSMVGLQNPLDAPHHMRVTEWLPYREGVVIANKKNKNAFLCSIIYAVLPVLVKTQTACPLKTRVTVLLNKQSKCEYDDILKKNKIGYLQDLIRKYLDSLNTYSKENKKSYSNNSSLKNTHFNFFIRGEIVKRSDPLDNYGIHWGYNVNVASSLKQVLFNENYSYDLIIGTSERGTPIQNVFSEFNEMDFKNCLIVFGGVNGIEEMIEDEQSELPIMQPTDLFKYYLNFCYNQHSRTIRTEEALIITLSILRPLFV